jgi:hypothetical protein
MAEGPESDSVAPSEPKLAVPVPRISAGDQSAGA